MIMVGQRNNEPASRIASDLIKHEPDNTQKLKFY